MQWRTLTDGRTAATYSNIWQVKIIPGQQSERTLRVTRQEVAEKGDNTRAIDESYSPREHGGKIVYCRSSWTYFRCPDEIVGTNQPMSRNSIFSSHCIKPYMPGLEYSIHRRPKIRTLVTINDLALLDGPVTQARVSKRIGVVFQSRNRSPIRLMLVLSSERRN